MTPAVNFDALGDVIDFLIGKGAMLTSNSIAFAQAAKDIGADAISLASPPYSAPTDRENALNAVAIDKAADLSSMLYNFPHRTGTMMAKSFWTALGAAGISRASKKVRRH